MPPVLQTLSDRGQTTRGIQVEWGDETQTVLVYRARGRWTWDDFYRASRTARVMMDNTPTLAVDFIVDMSDGNLLPVGLFSNMLRFNQNKHPKAGQMVVVGALPFARALFNQIGRILPRWHQTLWMVESIDEAWAILD